MIYDHVYARRLAVNILMVTLGLAALTWLFPSWTPSTAALRPASPQVLFLPRGPYKSAEQAAVWSPATIALPGLPARHQAELRDGTPVPLLESPAILAPLPTEASIAARAEPDQRQLVISAAPTTQSFRIQVPVMRPFPAATGMPDVEIYCEDSNHGAPVLVLDHTSMDLARLPKPDTPCTAVLFLCFDDAGVVRSVLLETPTSTPELNHALVRQAYRARTANLTVSNASQCVRLHFLFGY